LAAGWQQSPYHHQSPGDEISGANYRLKRRPSFGELIKLSSLERSVFPNNISLRSLVPALLLRKKTLVSIQTWLAHTRGEMTGTRLKRALLPRVTNVGD